MAKEVIAPALRVLGLSSLDTTADAIKRAFRDRAKKCHPDVCKDTAAAARFRELSDAKDTLLDAVFVIDILPGELGARLRRDSIFF
jgi:hypothetical protein